MAAFLHEEGFAQEIRQSGFAEIMRDRLAVVADPREALTVFDFEETARRNVQAGHWAYMASGTDDDSTLHANRAAFRQVQLRPRRLRDATQVDIRTELFGERYASPIFL
ncbi:MAG TPA: alpha-hydroxy-acid oxidizing protein, partial [Usitatibacter sp.]|nr:alpha-hydroxy-acid oxidizing protein [Usitatibacter sp.]